jgi:hypothetical protein
MVTGVVVHSVRIVTPSVLSGHYHGHRHQYHDRHLDYHHTHHDPHIIMITMITSTPNPTPHPHHHHTCALCSGCQSRTRQTAASMGSRAFSGDSATFPAGPAAHVITHAWGK